MIPKVYLAAESLTAGLGGIARVARLLAKILDTEARLGHLRVSAVTLNGTPASGEFSFPVRSMRGSRIRFVCEASGAALTHTHFLYDALGMARAHGQLPLVKKPFASYVHGIEVWEDAPANRVKTAMRARLLVSNTNYTKQRMTQAHGEMPETQVCWLATETDKPARTPLEQSRPTVLILGALRRVASGGYKGQKELIECWPDVVARVPDARLIVAGGGPGYEHLKNLAYTSSVASQIEMRGFVPEDHIESLWQETSVYAMPARTDGFGLVYIEAMRHGLPVIASIHDGGQEVNVHGVTGYNVDLDVPGELADRIAYLLENPETAREMGARGQERWKEHFCFSAFRSRVLPILESFVECRLGNGA